MLDIGSIREERRAEEGSGGEGKNNKLVDT